jgi:hypothetical protein
MRLTINGDIPQSVTTKTELYCFSDGLLCTIGTDGLLCTIGTHEHHSLLLLRDDDERRTEMWMETEPRGVMDGNLKPEAYHLSMQIG